MSAPQDWVAVAVDLLARRDLTFAECTLAEEWEACLMGLLVEAKLFRALDGKLAEHEDREEALHEALSEAVCLIPTNQRTALAKFEAVLAGASIESQTHSQPKGPGRQRASDNPSRTY